MWFLPEWKRSAHRFLSAWVDPIPMECPIGMAIFADGRQNIPYKKIEAHLLLLKIKLSHTRAHYFKLFESAKYYTYSPEISLGDAVRIARMFLIFTPWIRDWIGCLIDWLIDWSVRLRAKMSACCNELPRCQRRQW